MWFSHAKYVETLGKKIDLGDERIAPGYLRFEILMGDFLTDSIPQEITTFHPPFGESIFGGIFCQPETNGLAPENVVVQPFHFHGANLLSQFQGVYSITVEKKAHVVSGRAGYKHEANQSYGSKGIQISIGMFQNGLQVTATHHPSLLVVRRCF